MAHISKTVHKELVRDNNTNALINIDDEGYKKVVAERNKSKTQNALVEEVKRLNIVIEKQRVEIVELKTEILSLKKDFVELKNLVLNLRKK